MKTTLRHALLATVAILGFGGLGAMAAPPPEPAMTTPAMTTPATPASVAPTPQQTMTERVNARITELHASLNITPAQAKPWNHFAAVMRANALDMDKTMHRRMDQLPTMNAEQNMRSYMQVAATHARDMHKLVPAFEGLYATMSPSQKATADEMFRKDAYRGKPARQG